MQQYKTSTGTVETKIEGFPAITLTLNKRNQWIITRANGKRTLACECLYGVPEIEGYHGKDQSCCKEKCGPTHCERAALGDTHVHLIEKEK